MAEDTDQLSVNLALAIPEQDLAETPTTNTVADAVETAQMTADVIPEHSVPITLDSDLLQLQLNLGLDYVAAIVPVRSDIV